MSNERTAGTSGPSESSGDSLEMLTGLIRQFVSARRWNQYDNPKNLAMAISGEAGELLAELQWLTESQSELAYEQGPLRDEILEEMADVLIYLVRLAGVMQADLLEAARSKMAKNSVRFPLSAEGSPRGGAHPKPTDE